MSKQLENKLYLPLVILTIGNFEGKFEWKLSREISQQLWNELNEQIYGEFCFTINTYIQEELDD